MPHGNRPRRGETVKYRELTYLPETPVSAASGSLGAAIIPFRRTRRSGLLVVLALAAMALGLKIPCYGQATTIFDCPAFASSGSCGVDFIETSGKPFAVQGGTNGITPALSGASVNFAPIGSSHIGLSLNYKTAQVDVQAFSTNFTFVPGQWTLAFVINNSNNGPNFNGSSFSAGAGCEAGFYQAFSQPLPPNNVFALMLDQYDAIPAGGGTFTYSSAQIYQQGETPCNPNDSQSPYASPQNKVSTFPVPLNSPANGENTTTGDTYSASIIYTGTVLTLNLFDKTTGGSCPGASCFSYSWNVGSIPSMVSGTTAWVGLTNGTGNAATTNALHIDSFSYSVLSPAATPTFSPNAGTYGGTQSVTISDSTENYYACYNFTGAPATNGIGGCANGTLYSGAIPVPSGRTIYAVAGVSGGAADSAVASAAFNINSTASIPTFNQPGGTFNGTQTVQLTAPQGGVICYNTTGSPATDGGAGCTTGSLYSTPITVSSNETLYAVAGGTGLTDSSVGSATYKINPFAGTPGANSPTFSPLPGTYTGAQSVKLSTTTPDSYICYLLASSSSPPALPPQPNNMGGCTEGTVYGSPVTVASSQTLYATTGTSWNSSAAPPSSLVQGAYVISSDATAPAAPTNPKATAVPTN
jgi:hypothetical protein